MKKLENLLVDNIHVEKHYQGRWLKLTDQWRRELGVRVNGTSNNRTQKAFEGYRFTPYFIHHMYLDGLRVRYRDNNKNRIYHALFNEHFDFNSPIVGDQYEYGMEQWLIDNPDMNNYWKMYPPKSTDS